MKKLIILLLTLTLILGVLVSCNNKRYLPVDDETTSKDTNKSTQGESFGETNNSDNVSEDTVTVETLETIDGAEASETTFDVDTADPASRYNYTLKKVGDQWYMAFDSYVSDPSYQLSYLYFETDSMETIKQAIFNNELDKSQKRIILTVCERDEIGIPIPDILNPILPSNVVVYQAFWERDQFVVSFCDVNFSFAEGQIDGAMYDLDEAGFIEKYNAAAEENIYVSEDGTKTIVLLQVKNQYIDEDYLYVKIGDNYVYFKISGLPDNPDKDLIMSFGFEVLT